ncbi:hypothetical protein JK386_06250 [Nocardioides sp. zg-536]|uniref:Uncharacterized protein n=1 Tax=Nocardioides faecalis TaxID=2803858 RepID=A0A938XZR5_9ACTN|nr:hypothetical protein [Nocardioides faecalis]MBM9459497.1 hypothetical protein [Nocardioides faecalis]QVI59403.1 hypothetical protein KG111_03265 [Nocardioides faecalis]
MEEKPDLTGELAAIIGLEIEEFAELFGAGWRVEEPGPWHDYDADPSGGEGCPATPWHVAGDPAQLMIRVFAHGVFLASPHGRSIDHRVAYRPERQQYVAAYELEQAREVVKRLHTSRRRTFRYCRYCRVHTAPEGRFDHDVCYGCATTWFGIIY